MLDRHKRRFPKKEICWLFKEISPYHSSFPLNFSHKNSWRLVNKVCAQKILLAHSSKKACDTFPTRILTKQILKQMNALRPKMIFHFSSCLHTIVQATAACKIITCLSLSEAKFFTIEIQFSYACIKSEKKSYNILSTKQYHLSCSMFVCMLHTCVVYVKVWEPPNREDGRRRRRRRRLSPFWKQRRGHQKIFSGSNFGEYLLIGSWGLTSKLPNQTPAWHPSLSLSPNCSSLPFCFKYV